MTQPTTLEPPHVPVLRRIKSIAPLQFGKFMALMYGIVGLLACPLFLVIAFINPHQGSSGFFGLGMFSSLLLPFIYALVGFVTGVFSAYLYNVVAEWVGGIEVEVA